MSLLVVLQPPVEVLQMARILDDSAMTVSVLELDKLITEVLSVVPSQTNEEASVALYDNNFDVGRAITVLLDSDTGVTTVSWIGVVIHLMQHH